MICEVVQVFERADASGGKGDVDQATAMRVVNLDARTLRHLVKELVGEAEQGRLKVPQHVAVRQSPPDLAAGEPHDQLQD